MAQTKVYYDNGWSYSGDNKLNYLGTFYNPSSSERAEISSLTVYIGTVYGPCTWGDSVYGSGNSFQTYMKAGGVSSGYVTVSNVVTTFMGAGGYTPNQSQCTAHTFYFSTPVSVSAGSSAEIYIWCPNAASNQVIAYRRSEPYGITVTYENIPNKKPNPTSVTIECTDFDAHSISWKVKTGSTATSCKVYRDGSEKGKYSLSGNVAKGVFSGISSSIHKISAAAVNGNSDWVYSSSVTVDCTTPPINNLKITPTASNKGTLNFTSTYNVNYTLKGADGVTYATGRVDANKNPKAKVSLKNNSVQKYTLYISRIDNKKIGNSKSAGSVNTRKAVIKLTGSPAGLNYKFNAKSDILCNTWKYTLLDKSTGLSSTYTYNTSDDVSTSGLIKNLKPNTTYELHVSAITTESGLSSTSNSISFKPQGVVRIANSEKDKIGVQYTVFVYDTKEEHWDAVVPYVWDGNNWVVCV